MKIAQVAPLYESVPPTGYGGTERVVSWLTEELVRKGHDVTLFASGDSQTAAELVPGCSTSLRTSPQYRDPLIHHFQMLEEVRRRKDDFDIVHFHTDYLHFPLSRDCQFTQVTTLHGRLDIPDLVSLYQEFSEMPVVSISRSQRTPLPHANWVGNIYHGLPESLLSFNSSPGKYLAFLGRIAPEKRPDRAIEIATLAGMQLKIAAKVDPADKQYFDNVIKPLLTRRNVEFVGEISDSEKSQFLGNAVACLTPIDWPEPFGLIMIESMACGTPVIAFRNGSVPEIIEDGVSGRIVDSIEEAVAAVHQAKAMSRKACRDAFVRRFTVTRMAQEYLALYRRQIEKPLTRLERCIAPKLQPDLAVEDAA